MPFFAVFFIFLFLCPPINISRKTARRDWSHPYRYGNGVTDRSLTKNEYPLAGEVGWAGRMETEKVETGLLFFLFFSL